MDTPWQQQTMEVKTEFNIRNAIQHNPLLQNNH